MSEQRPRILYFKEFIPTPVCILLSLFFAMVFQFNGGVFLPTSTQMSSALGCLREDVMMAGYASFIGMTVIFPILFRLKFRFTTRRIFLTVCPVLIVCNLITMQSQNIAILVATCFVSGFFRMWGTFECFSNIRLSVTPSGNFSVFYPVIYIIVLESIQLSGLVATHLSDWANWQYMHWLVIGLLIVVWFCVFFLTRPFRVAKKMPLYGRCPAVDTRSVRHCLCLHLRRILRLAGQPADPRMSGNCCRGHTDQHQPDVYIAPPVY